MLANLDLAKAYAALVGVFLVVIGLVGFVSNPLVGDATATSSPLFVTGDTHNLIHIVTGALALYICFGLKGDQQTFGVIAFGGLYIAILLLTLINPSLFGILNYPVNLGDHLLHAALGVVSIGVGYLARNQSALAR